MVLLPSLVEAGFDRRVAVASASGLSARRIAERAGFERAVSGGEAVIDDPDVDVVVIATPHDTHARLAAAALRAGKDVFCEKPLALSLDELEDVEAAYASAGGVLFVGFNRRWSPAVEFVRRHFGTGSHPLALTYRVSAGMLPASHWYHDRRQGGRLLGEVCHFVDTCAALAGEDAIDTVAVGSSRAEAVLADELAVALRYPSGSVASITYGTGGHPRTEKERVEVLGGGRSAVIVDFREVALDGGKPVPARGKGHREEAQAFLRAVRAGSREVALPAFASTRSTLQAAASLTRR
jgi:predicted dehydrogenase